MLSISDPRLPWPRYIGMRHVKTYVLPEDMLLGHEIVAKGTTIKLFQTRNFGWVILPEPLLGSRRRIFKY